MAEAPRQASEDEILQEGFARIEAAVEAGDTDLSKLGFWKLVRRVKVDPLLSQRWADVVGRIDDKAFRAAVRPRFPIWFGNGVLALGTLAGGGALSVAVVAEDPTVSGGALVAAGVIWAVSLHDLAHWVTGRLAGMRFSSYFLGGMLPVPLYPGLKSDYASYLRADPRARVWMHASGALATKVAPFVPLTVWKLTAAPRWAALTLAGVGVLQIVTDILFSTRKSDWKKVRRERAIARARA
ncbi:MAG TPA: hypothetical protein VE646_07415 [Actinomycetota bacterium]|jgi:hypothetical protein|nr:hypothetical protein [Actinomycetota bacterium]